MSSAKPDKPHSSQLTGRQIAGGWRSWILGPHAYVLLGLAFVAFVLGQPACADKTCTPSDGDNSTPGPAFECAAGEVCYLGRCITTCSAGAELFEECRSDDDCSGSRPNCVRGFCSSCVDIETCVPTLNICRPVNEVDLPEPLERPPGGPQAVPRPLDAGFAAGGIVRPTRDGGVEEQPVDREVTRAVLIDLGREIDYSAQPAVERGIAVVRSFNTQIGAGNGLKWRVGPTPPRVESSFPDPAQDPNAPQGTIDEFCEVRKLEPLTGPGGAPTPTNIGEIRMVNPSDFPNSIQPELTAAFDPGTNQYEIMPGPVTPTFLTYSVSVPTEPHFVFISGAVLADVVVRVWPEETDFGHHVPFELIPTPTTQSALQASYRVADPAAEDLVFRYERIETGNDGFEAIFVRITGNQTELFCEQREGPGLGGELRIRAGILNAFRQAEGMNQTSNYELIFERASRELIQAPGAPGQLVLVTVRVRHSLKTPIVFEATPVP